MGENIYFEDVVSKIINNFFTQHMIQLFNKLELNFYKY